MSTIASLHTELLLLIFDHLKSVKDVAQCRIVCKSWDSPAERSLFGKTLKVTSEESAFKLYRHLFRNPSNAKLIKHLEFNLEDENLPYNVEQLMDLAITPNIRQLTGTVNAKKFYDILCKTLGDASVEYKYLERIPDHKLDDDYNNQIRWKLKDYLSYTTIYVHKPIQGSSLNSILSQLDQFPKLKGIFIAGIGNHSDLAATLRCTSNLQSLKILFFSFDFARQPIMSKAEFMEWATRNVKKESNMHEVTICNDVRHDFVEHLMFKYPNVKKINFFGAALRFDSDRYGEEEVDFDGMHRLLDALKSVKTKNISLRMPENMQMKPALEFADSRPEKITFTVDKYATSTALNMHIETN